MVAPDGSDPNVGIVGAFASAAVVVFGAPKENEPVAAAAPAAVAAFVALNENPLAGVIGDTSFSTAAFVFGIPNNENPLPGVAVAPKVNPAAELVVEEAVAA